jgi:hypothetical protein
MSASDPSTEPVAPQSKDGSVLLRHQYPPPLDEPSPFRCITDPINGTITKVMRSWSRSEGTVVMDTRNEAVRAALMRLGWTPPPESQPQQPTTLTAPCHTPKPHPSQTPNSAAQNP